VADGSKGSGLRTQGAGEREKNAAGGPSRSEPHPQGGEVQLVQDPEEASIRGPEQKEARTTRGGRHRAREGRGRNQNETQSLISHQAATSTLTSQKGPSPRDEVRTKGEGLISLAKPDWAGEKGVTDSPDLKNVLRPGAALKKIESTYLERNPSSLFNRGRVRAAGKISWMGPPRQESSD